MTEINPVSPRVTATSTLLVVDRWAAFKGLKLECKQASYQDSSVERFSVMIGVWGGADSLR